MIATMTIDELRTFARLLRDRAPRTIEASEALALALDAGAEALEARAQLLTDPPLDIFRGGDPRCFRPHPVVPTWPSSAESKRRAFALWFEQCEAAERDEPRSRDLPPESDGITIAEDGSAFDASGSTCLCSAFDVGQNFAAPGPWREWAAPLRKRLLPVRIWMLLEERERALEYLDSPVRPPDPEDEEWERGWDTEENRENTRREIAETEAEIAALCAEMEAAP